MGEGLSRMMGELSSPVLWGEGCGDVCPPTRLIPVGVLGLLPLHAAWIKDSTLPTGRCYAIDRLTLTYAPNARALNAAQAIANQVETEAFLAIADPQPVSTAPLRNAGYEVAAAISMFPQHHVLKHAEATRSAVLAELPGYAVLHCSCHGYANLVEPLTSGLAMSNDEVLSLRDLLDLRLVGARLAILSACETGVPGTTLPDEVISLPTGLLQAGFAGVAASLWSVEDISTTMLMFRFYDLWRSAKLEPPEALRRSQQWHRDTTIREKIAYFKSYMSTQLANKIPVSTVDYLYKSLILSHPNDRNFAHPFHWAAFTYVGV